VLEDAVQRPRNSCEIERLDQKPRVLDLAGTAAEEAAELALCRPTLPLRLLLERAKGREVSVPRENLLDGLRAERADQFVLEVRVADIETELLPSTRESSRS
jgi:hypothetical protein